MNLIIFFSNEENKDVSFRILCLLNLKQCKILALVNKEMNSIITKTMYQLFVDFYSSVDEYEITKMQLKKFRWILKWLYMKNMITLESIMKKYLRYESALFKPITEIDKKFKKYLFTPSSEIHGPNFYDYCDIILPLVLNTNNKPASEAGKLIILDRPRNQYFKPNNHTHIETITIEMNDSVFIGNKINDFNFIGNDELYKKINSFFLHNSDEHVLMWAIQCGYLDVVQYYFFKTQIKYDEHTFMFVNGALVCASESGHLKIVQYLISMGADPEANDNEAIKSACMEGQLEVVKYLVSVGVDFSCRDYYSLRTAHTNNHVEVVDYLKSLGEQYIDKALISASKKHKLETIKHLILLSETPKIIDAFCTAYHGGFYDVMRYLETLICDVSPLSCSLLSSEVIFSAIVGASEYNDITTLQILMTAYANYINREEIIKEILPYALTKNQFKIIEYLISIIFLPLVSHTYEQIYEKNIKSCTNVNIVNIYYVLDGVYVLFGTPSGEHTEEHTEEHKICFSSEKITVFYPNISYMYKSRNYIPLVEDSKFIPFVENNSS
jgi:hypothetical protein